MRAVFALPPFQVSLLWADLSARVNVKVQVFGARQAAVWFPVETGFACPVALFASFGVPVVKTPSVFPAVLETSCEVTPPTGSSLPTLGAVNASLVDVTNGAALGTRDTLSPL